MFFSWKTLLLLAPMAIALEFGLILFAVRGGWWNERKKVYAYWFNPKNWQMWFKKRAYIQSIRTIRDRDLLDLAVTGIYFQDKSTDNPLVNYIANPIMTVYYWLIVKPFIWW
jgi:hypothetical protein